MNKMKRCIGLLRVAFGVLSVGALSAQAGNMNLSWGHKSSFGVDAIKAWSLVKNKCATSGVTVAVIDTGIDSQHPDLKNSLWTNAKEINGKPGVDDDGNGFVDDKHGWDFVTKSGKIIDVNRHGTHIAGIVGARAGSSSGYSGICPGVKLMSLRYFDQNASGIQNLQNTVRSIEYAVANGADIINYSGGGAEFSRAEMMALKKAERKGILVVAAAGNERSNADKNLYFPAAYKLNNIFSVTALNRQGRILPSSNWGVEKVHIAAPGNSILSTLPGGSYGVMTGTSQATAFVSGIAALMLSVNPSLTVKQIKDRIIGSSVAHKQLKGKTTFGTAANAHKAVTAALEGSKFKAPTPRMPKVIKARKIANSHKKVTTPRKRKVSKKTAATESPKVGEKKSSSSLLWSTILPSKK